MELHRLLIEFHLKLFCMKKTLFPVICVLCVHILQAQVYTQTRTSTEIYYGRPSVWATTAWQNTVNDDNRYISTKTLRGGTTWPIQFQKFGFNIPSNAIIQGIDVSMIRHKTGKSNVKDNFASLVTGDDFANSGGNIPSQAKAAYWTSTEAGAVYTFAQSGTGTDGNPYSWTAEKINKLYFGFFFDIQILLGGGAVANIEKLSITVRYTLPSTVASNLQLTPLNKSVIASANDKGMYNFVVRDISGRLVQRSVLTDPQNTTVFLNNQLPGVYLVSLEGANSKKTIKTYIR
jgi:hypothetical protein